MGKCEVNRSDDAGWYAVDEDVVGREVTVDHQTRGFRVPGSRKLFGHLLQVMTKVRLLAGAGLTPAVIASGDCGGTPMHAQMLMEGAHPTREPRAPQ